MTNQDDLSALTPARWQPSVVTATTPRVLRRIVTITPVQEVIVRTLTIS